MVNSGLLPTRSGRFRQLSLCFWPILVKNELLPKPLLGFFRRIPVISRQLPSTPVVSGGLRAISGTNRKKRTTLVAFGQSRPLHSNPAELRPFPDDSGQFLDNSGNARPILVVSGKFRSLADSYGEPRLYSGRYRPIPANSGNSKSVPVAVENFRTIPGYFRVIPVNVGQLRQFHTSSANFRRILAIFSEFPVNGDHFRAIPVISDQLRLIPINFGKCRSLSISATVGNFW